MQDHSGEGPWGTANIREQKSASKTNWRLGLVAILRSARHALSLRLLSIQVVAYAPGYVIYLVLTYSSWALSGRMPASVWAEWGLQPCLFAADQPRSLAAWSIYGFGVAALAIAFLLSNAAGSRLLWMKWRGHNAYSVREAYDFAIAKMSAILIAPAALILLIALFVGGGWLVGMVGRIPYMGELIITSFAWLWILAAFVSLLLAVIAGLTFILAPAIVATTDEGPFEAILQTAGILWSQPWRLLLYLAGAIVAALAGLMALAFLVKRAFLLMDALFATAMGADYQNLSTQAQYLLQNWSAANKWKSLVAPELAAPFLFSRPITPLALTPWLDVLAHILALALLFSAVWILAYPLAIINSGLMLTALLLRKINDGETPFSGENPLERYQAHEPTSP